MALAAIAFSELKRRVGDACRHEDAYLSTFRIFAQRLRDDVRAIRPYSISTYAFVSSDSRDNRMYFNPAAIELLHIVDSDGNQRALDAITGNFEAADLTGEPLRRFCKELRLKSFPLSDYRDILEWAVLLDVLQNTRNTPTIIVRDGMLRTKSFKPSVFAKLEKLLKDGQKGMPGFIAGIASQSAVPSLFSVALDLEETLHRPYPCYVLVPADVAESCYRYNRTWAPGAPEEGFQSLGRLFLVKFGVRPFDPVWPVDIASWQLEEVDVIIGGLARDSQAGFPLPDFPMCVQRAHDFARVNAFEMDILQDIFLDGISGAFTPAEKEKVLRMKYLALHLTHIKQKNA